MIHAYIFDGGRIEFHYGDRVGDGSASWFAETITGDMDSPNGQPFNDLLAGLLTGHDERTA
jgi:hypothetical protein